ncbi:MAG: FecR domain-containing protein [Terracidiphilus sp.]
MKRDDILFDAAVRSLQADEPDAMQVAASARRVAGRLGIDGVDNALIEAIESCHDVRQLFPSYRSGSLSKARSLLVESHLRDCSVCRRQFRGGSAGAGLDWSAPTTARAIAWRSPAFAWSLAFAAAMLVSALFVYKAFWQIPPGVRAEVRSIDGAAYRISDTGDRQLAPGDKLAEGERVRTSGGAHAVLQLADGSTIEVNERSILGLGARGNNTTVTLDDGAMIVQAAKRTSGHLYVKTPDCRVAVTGTVFSVNSGIKGSRVAVLQGTVDVLHAGVDTLIHAGDQVSTSDKLSPQPMEKQIAWSHDREKYLPLLEQFATLKNRLEQIPFPQPRYSSDLISRVPADSSLYISIPNLGDFLSQADQIFDDQLKQSPALEQWWNQGHNHNTADLDSLVSKIHQMSQYLGDEVVVVGVKKSDDPSFAIIADLKQAGLDDFLRQAIPSSSSNAGLTVLDQDSLAGVAISKARSGGFALILPDRAIFSNSIATLKLMNAQLKSGDSGFESSDFGKQIAAAYSRGAGIILAADIHQMMNAKANLMHAGNHGSDVLQKSGMDGARYLIAEHREVNGQPENQIAVQFSGTRQGVASWLAAPAPIGSLEFITPNASISVAALSKDPAAIADDIMGMTVADKGQIDSHWTEAEQKLQINFRDDLAATLGGDFLLALDGPVLPTPSWKAVIEVHDSQRLEQTLEKLAEAIRNLAKESQAQGDPAQGKQAHSITIESDEVAGQRFYSVRDTVSGNVIAQYTFANGYMVVAPNRAIVMEALHTYATGDSLAHAAAFRALLPKDANANYSAIAYQNLSPVAGPLLSQLSGESADVLRKLAADARPTVICVRGEESRIEAVSDSRLFGFDFLTLGTLMNIGNHHGPASVIQ